MRAEKEKWFRSSGAGTAGSFILHAPHNLSDATNANIKADVNDLWLNL